MKSTEKEFSFLYVYKGHVLAPKYGIRSLTNFITKTSRKSQFLWSFTLPNNSLYLLLLLLHCPDRHRKWVEVCKEFLTSTQVRSDSTEINLSYFKQ